MGIDNNKHDQTDVQPFPHPSRRTFLKAAVATGMFAGSSKIVLADDPEADIFLVGEMGGWEAEAPENIDGETNPLLELEVGQTYTLTWVNDDGFRHNFVIIDTNGDEVVRTPVMSNEGATQTVRFTATEDMSEYFCEIHPRTMRGEIRIGGRQPKDGTGSPIPLGGTIGIETIARGLTAPLGFEVAPGDTVRRFIVDQTGLIFVLGPDGLEDDPFLDVSDKIVELGVEELNGYDERGLLGLAFHPQFANNQTFYLRYSAPRRAGTPRNYDHTEVLSEFQARDGFDDDDILESERVILEIPSPQMNHNGGAVAFGPDGYLYTSIGDGGAANDVGLGHVTDWYTANEGGNGQDVTENLLGSILRIDVDSREGNKPYGIPNDNPLVGTDGLDEHFAWGFRNPWRMSFNNGQLFVGDAGQNLWEEVSIVEKGGNYGWNVKEGTHCFSTETPNEPPADCPDTTPPDVRGGEPLHDPIIEYRHRRSTTAFIDGSVVIGGFFYENTAVETIEGTYVFGNWSGDGILQPDGEIFAATPPADGDGLWSIEELRIAGSDNQRLNHYVMAFGRDHEGELYVLTTDNFTPTGETGAVHKLVPA